MGLSTTYTKVETDYKLQELQKFIASGLKGTLKITDAAPTVQGLYILSDVGTYTNLGGIVTTAGKINYAYFDGTTWSKVEVAIPQFSQNIRIYEDLPNGTILNPKEQVISNNVQYIVLENAIVGTDLPGISLKFTKIESLQGLINISPSGKMKDLAEIKSITSSVTETLSADGITFFTNGSETYPGVFFNDFNVVAENRYAIVFDLNFVESTSITLYLNGDLSSQAKFFFGQPLNERKTLIAILDNTDTQIARLRLQLDQNSEIIAHKAMVLNLGNSTSVNYNLTESEILALYEKSGYFKEIQKLSEKAVDAQFAMKAAEGSKLLEVETVFTQILQKGALQNLTDISTTRVTSLVSDGIKIENSSTATGVNFEFYETIANHNYIIVLDYTPLTAWYGIDFFREKTSGIDQLTISTPTTLARKVITGILHATNTNNMPLVMYLQPEQDMILHSIMVFDAGLAGSETITESEALQLYQNFGFFTKLPIAQASKNAEKAAGIVDSETAVTSVKRTLSHINLKDLVINWLGDSITFQGFAIDGQSALYDGFIYQTAKSLGLEFSNMKSYAVGGNMLAIPQGGNDDTLAGGGAKAMCVRIKEMTSSNVNIVMGGSNDTANSVIVHGSEATKNDKTTIYGAVYQTIKAHRDFYPNSILIWMIPPRKSGGRYGTNDLYQITNTIRICLEYYGVPYIDFFQKSGINEFNIQSNPNLLIGVTWSADSNLDASGNLISGSRFVSAFFTAESEKHYYTGGPADIYFYDSSNVFVSKTSISANAGNDVKIPATATKVRLVQNEITGGVIDGSNVDLRFSLIDGDLISDTVHPNKRGHDAMKALLIEELKKYIYNI